RFCPPRTVLEDEAEDLPRDSGGQRRAAADVLGGDLRQGPDGQGQPKPEVVLLDLGGPPPEGRKGSQKAPAVGPPTRQEDEHTLPDRVAAVGVHPVAQGEGPRALAAPGRNRQGRVAVPQLGQAESDKELRHGSVAPAVNAPAVCRNEQPLLSQV